MLFAMGVPVKKHVLTSMPSSKTEATNLLAMSPNSSCPTRLYTPQIVKLTNLMSISDRMPSRPHHIPLVFKAKRLSFIVSLTPGMPPAMQTVPMTIPPPALPKR